MSSNSSTFDLQSKSPPPFRTYTLNEWWPVFQRWAKLKFRNGPNKSTEIKEYERFQAGKIRTKKGTEFLADAVNGHFGKKFPITAREIMNNAWT
jgi:hypothetical protein